MYVCVCMYVRIYGSMHVCVCKIRVYYMYIGWNPCLPQLQDRDDDSVETRSLSTFGRGAHGRLGCGSNRGHSRPTLVSKWPPSLTSKGTFQTLFATHTLQFLWNLHSIVHVYINLGMNRWQFLGVACGGAHTLALAAYPVKKCLANPYGMKKLYSNVDNNVLYFYCLPTVHVCRSWDGGAIMGIWHQRPARRCIHTYIINWHNKNNNVFL